MTVHDAVIVLSCWSIVAGIFLAAAGVANAIDRQTRAQVNVVEAFLKALHAYKQEQGK